MRGFSLEVQQLATLGFLSPEMGMIIPHFSQSLYLSAKDRVWSRKQASSVHCNHLSVTTKTETVRLALNCTNILQQFQSLWVALGTDFGEKTISSTG